MGFSWIFASLVCVLMADWSHAVCDENYMARAEVLDCSMAFSSYISEQGDPSQMMNAFCSEEGMSALSCMFPILEEIKKCPDNPMAAGMAAAIPMTSKADFERACKQISPTSPCAAAAACMQAASQGIDMGIDENFRPTNNMTALLPLLGMTCGPMKEQFNCITAEVEEQCPDIPAQLKQMVPMMSNNMPDGLAFPEYDVLKEFIRTGCTGVPEDISTHKCSMDHMESAALKDCMAKVDTDFKLPMEMKSCGAVDARRMCMKESIEPCGKNYYDALVNKGDTFLVKKVFTCNRDTSAAPVLRLSAAASFLAVVAALLL